MNSEKLRWPDQLAANTVCFTVDVEWAASEVVEDVKKLFDRFGVRATFFVTHAGVAVPGHERGLHPNFRRNGDTYRTLENAGQKTDTEVYWHVVRSTSAFAPEAKGVRAHSLFSDSALLPLYREAGLEYDSSYQMPFVKDIRPFWVYGPMLELPTYYGDFLDIAVGMSEFDVAKMGFDQPGLKVLNFHPNIVFLNAADRAAYTETAEHYRTADKLLSLRNNGRGIRTLLIDILEHVRRHDIPTATLGEVNRHWRTLAKGW